MSLFKMASFRQHHNENIKFFNSNIKFFKSRNLQEKKWIVQLINLILGDDCPKNLRLQFFGSAEEKDIKIKERNTKIKEILKAIRNVVQPSKATFQSNEAAFQPSEAWWHPVGCQCDDDDCVLGTLRASGAIIHPDDCQCTPCTVIRLVACCLECFAHFNDN
jgi:hypothetical protein